MNWQKLAVVIVPAVILILIGVFMFHRRQRTTAAMQTAKAPVAASAAAASQLRKAPDVTSLKSAQQLVGMQVWMQDGYLDKYFPFEHGHVNYAKPAGLAPPSQAMKIEKIVTQRKPARIKTHVPGGSQQVLAVFTMSGSQQSYALPIGYIQGKSSEFNCSQMFYYNSPHLIYAYWPQQVWSEIEKHEAAVGMSPMQVQAALGVNQKIKTEKKGAETITYNTGKEKWTVAYKNAKAVAVHQG
jgi:hypothetical protein